MKKQLGEVMGYLVPLVLILGPFVWVARDWDWEMVLGGMLVFTALGPGLLVFVVLLYVSTLLVGFVSSFFKLLKTVFE